MVHTRYITNIFSVVVVREEEEQNRNITIITIILVFRNIWENIRNVRAHDKQLDKVKAGRIFVHFLNYFFRVEKFLLKLPFSNFFGIIRQSQQKSKELEKENLLKLHSLGLSRRKQLKKTFEISNDISDIFSYTVKTVVNDHSWTSVDMWSFSDLI